MILTQHGINSLYYNTLEDVHLLTYFKLDDNGYPICVKGEFAGSASQAACFVTEGNKETPFGTMNFVHGINYGSEWGPFIPFRYKLDDPEYIKTHPIQLEVIGNFNTYNSLLRHLFLQRIVACGYSSNMVFESRIQGNAACYPSSNGIGDSFYYYSSSGPGNYYYQIAGKTSITDRYVHYCVVIDYANCAIKFWVDGTYLGKIILNQTTRDYYTSNFNLVEIVINERASVSQLCVRDAIWTEEKDYIPPSKPYN